MNTLLASLFSAGCVEIKGIRRLSDYQGEESVTDQQHQREQQTRQAVKVRQVTEAHPNWNELERGEHGHFTLQTSSTTGRKNTCCTRRIVTSGFSSI